MLSKYLTITPGEILLPLFSTRSFTGYKVASSLPLLLPRARLTTLHLYHCAKTYNAYCFV
ncbi:hypothetical protein E1A91_D06G203000v1 [Gossypium mustelinum]|uniref:Uncharacterized protein n=1 Tax=Gossypium mustelinum TaxID=34275 RepID=A0A5D2UN89_GOSMU|nr:hypothetical protein E1A91_D06G203000v1 [Gossypium mustelinum]